MIGNKSGGAVKPPDLFCRIDIVQGKGISSQHDGMAGVVFTPHNSGFLLVLVRHGFVRSRDIHSLSFRLKKLVSFRRIIPVKHSHLDARELCAAETV